MAKTVQIARILLAFAIGPGVASIVVVPQHVLAQSNANPANTNPDPAKTPDPANTNPESDSLLRGRNLAPTGATLPRPGVSQIGPESAQERGAQRRSDRDTHSICSNCE